MVKLQLRASNSIGGLMIHLYYDETKQHGNGDVTVRAPKDGVSELAIAAIREAGMDASDELIQTCRDLIEAVDKEAIPKTPPWRTLKPEVQKELASIFIEDIRDSLREYAHDELDKLDLTELALYLIEDEDGELIEDPDQEEVEAWIAANVVTPEEQPNEG